MHLIFRESAPARVSNHERGKDLCTLRSLQENADKVLRDKQIIKSTIGIRHSYILRWPLANQELADFHKSLAVRYYLSHIATDNMK